MICKTVKHYHQIYLIRYSYICCFVNFTKQFCFLNNTCLQKINYFNPPSCSNGDIALANGSKSQTGHVLLKWLRSRWYYGYPHHYS